MMREPVPFWRVVETAIWLLFALVLIALLQGCRTLPEPLPAPCVCTCPSAPLCPGPAAPEPDPIDNSLELQKFHFDGDAGFDGPSLLGMDGISELASGAASRRPLIHRTEDGGAP